MKSPNVLIILTDQQRKDSLGAYGNSIARTPNFDQLAASGIRFNRNYVANPICMPNRLSLFTGQTIRSHGLWTNGLLIDERPTLPDWFARHGYETASIGKIHFTPFGGKGGNKESSAWWSSEKADTSWTGPYWGFNHVELTIGHTNTIAHYGEWFRAKGGTEDMLAKQPYGPAGGASVRAIPPELHDSAFVADRTIARLRDAEKQEAPFFLAASFPDPHHPFDPPEAVAREWDPEEIDPPSTSDEDLGSRPGHYQSHFEERWHRSGTKDAPPRKSAEKTAAVARERIAATHAMVELIDRNVGRILDTLAETGMDKNTIVVFTSDHGELLGDHGLWYKGPFYYEGLMNTPLLAAGPGIDAGRTSDALVSALDLAPTLCEMAGLPPIPFADGVSQVPHLQNPNQVVREQCLIEYRNGYGAADISSKALVTSDLKYVRYETGEEELTDLEADPQETRNVAGEAAYRERRDQMRAALLDEILATEPKGPEQISLA